VTTPETKLVPLPLTRRPDALLLDAGDTLLFLDAAAVSVALADEGVALLPAAIDGAAHAAKQSYQRALARGERHEDGWTVLVQQLLVSAGLASDVARRVLPALRRVHDQHYFWRRVPAELPLALTRARAAGLRLGVVSNSEGRIAAMLERAGIASHFEVVVDSHLEGVAKPNPEIFRRALVRMQLAAARTLYAGDIPEVDVLGARAAGMEGVVVDPLGHHAGSAWPRVSSTAALIDALLVLPRG
jgi:putative hydrolase of the HAD superfamily